MSTYTPTADSEAENSPDPQQVAFERWLYHKNNQIRALNYVRIHARLTPEHVAIHPTPRYNRANKCLTIWLFEVNEAGEKVITPDGPLRTKHVVKVLVPPPWVQK